MPHLESSLRLATFFGLARGLSFGLVMKVSLEQEMLKFQYRRASLIANHVPGGLLAKKDGKMRMPGVYEV